MTCRGVLRFVHRLCSVGCIFLSALTIPRLFANLTEGELESSRKLYGEITRSRRSEVFIAILPTFELFSFQLLLTTAFYLRVISVSAKPQYTGRGAAKHISHCCPGDLQLFGARPKARHWTHVCIVYAISSITDFQTFSAARGTGLVVLRVFVFPPLGPIARQAPRGGLCFGTAGDAPF